MKDANERGALNFAARDGRTVICKYLLEDLNLCVDSRDDDGETPLIHATRQGHLQTATYLLCKVQILQQLLMSWELQLCIMPLGQEMIDRQL